MEFAALKKKIKQKVLHIISYIWSKTLDSTYKLVFIFRDLFLAFRHDDTRYNNNKNRNKFNFYIDSMKHHLC